jgi:predicted site-specific integrase-resolvase
MKLDLGGMVHRSDFCDQVGIVARTARLWELRGYGPRARRIGGRVYYVQDEIDTFLKEIRDGSTVVA